MGMTVADWWGVTRRKKNVTYLRDVDHKGFFKLLVDRIGKL
jgi:purine nucleosidase